jgi:hypothetical protein
VVNVVKGNWMRILKTALIGRFFFFLNDKIKGCKFNLVNIYNIPCRRIKMKKILLFLSLFFTMSTMTFAQTNSISLDLKDAPVRSTLEMAFKQAGIKNYVIDNEVAGFITMTITEQPFENTLKLIMRAATVPLTYIKENDIYIVKVRKVTEFKQSSAPDITIYERTSNVVFERIPLTFIDPIDLMSVLGPILNINQFNRMRGGSGNTFGNMGGGMGGFQGGGMMGGMGGGFNGNGMMGGMNGGMGAFGGGGGFGGGRNF